MRICIISPHATGKKLIGANLLQFYLLRFLPKFGHEAYLIHPTRGKMSIESQSNLRIFPARSPLIYRAFRSALRMLLNKIKWHPDFHFIFDFYFLSHIFKIINKIRPDLLISIYFGVAAPTTYISRLMNIPWIHIEADVDYDRIRKLMGKKIAFSNRVGLSLLKWLEVKLCNQADFIVTLTENDKLTLLDLGVKTNIKVIPLGVDSQIFKPLNHLKSKQIVSMRHRIKDEKILFFHGALSYGPNLDAVRTINDYIVPALKQRGQRVTAIVAGHGKLFKNLSNILYVGYVDDLTQYINAADVCIIPITTGSGMSSKALEYLSCGRPVVSTKFGVRGINVRNNVHLFIESGVNEKFVNDIFMLLNNPAKAYELGNNARRLIEKQYCWQEICTKYNKLINQLEDTVRS